jgi:hypothetical protein
VVEHGADHPVDVGGGDDLHGRALDHAVLGDRARERVGERAGEDAVGGPLQLGGGEQLECGRLDLGACTDARELALMGEVAADASQRRAHAGCPAGDAKGQERESPCGDARARSADRQPECEVRLLPHGRSSVRGRQRPPATSRCQQG